MIICGKNSNNIDDTSTKKVAFTLAEVLITLGIIGIVAALTLPSLIENHNKKVWVTALQKFYSTQQQGFQKMLVDEGAEKLEDTSVFQSIGPTSTSTMDFCQPGQSGNASCKMFFDNLKKYFQFNIITTASSPETYIYDLNGNIEDSYSGYSRVIALADGSFILSGSTFYKSELKGSETRAAKTAAGGGHMYSWIGDIRVDINGLKKPNTLGRDIFRFILSGDGKLYPDGGNDISLYNDGDLNHTWRNYINSSSCGSAPKPSSEELEFGFFWRDGMGCAARIMENGWVMDY